MPDAADPLVSERLPCCGMELENRELKPDRVSASGAHSEELGQFRGFVPTLCERVKGRQRNVLAGYP